MFLRHYQSICCDTAFEERAGQNTREVTVMIVSLPRNLEKSQEHLQIEATLRQYFDEKRDPNARLPHSFTYYQDLFQRLTRLYPSNLPLKVYDEFISEKAFIPQKDDVFIFHHLTCFPPIWHSNEFFTIRIILEGSGTLYIANQELKMTAGDICVVAPESRNALSAFSDSFILNVIIRRSTFDRTFFTVLNTEDNILSDFFIRTLYNTNPNPFLYFRANPDPEIVNILGSLQYELHMNRSLKKCMVSNLVDALFIMLLRNHSQDLVISENAQIKQGKDLIFMLKYMQEHFTTVSLKELSSFFSYSDRQVQRILKAGTGSTFMDNIQTMKMREAARLLTESHLPVSRIATDLGYGNMGNFRKIFEGTFHTAPSEYRKTHSAQQKRP